MLRPRSAALPALSETCCERRFTLKRQLSSQLTRTSAKGCLRLRGAGDLPRQSDLERARDQRELDLIGDGSDAVLRARERERLAQLEV